MLQSTINSSADNNSNQNVAKSDPKSGPLVDTHTSDGRKVKITDPDTTKGNYLPKLLTHREIPAIIQGVIPLVHQTTANGITTSGRVLHAVRTVLH